MIRSGAAVYAITDDVGTTRHYYAADGETACELHREKFDTLPITVEGHR